LEKNRQYNRQIHENDDDYDDDDVFSSAAAYIRIVIKIKSHINEIRSA
jgi:hypothetical protein